MKLDGTIYFVQAVDGGPIKIGFTSGDPNVRFAGLQASSPVRLKMLATRPGTMREELRMHLQLREHNAWFEWFEPAPAVMELVAASEPWSGSEIYMGFRRNRGGRPFGGAGASVAPQLSAWMSLHGKTLEEVAKILGCSMHHVCRLRRGKYGPGPALAKRIATMIA
jgi:hypothetical protein